VNTGAIIMLIIGAAGLWGGLVFFLRNYFKAEKAEREANQESENRES
jgi:hypothetical protein